MRKIFAVFFAFCAIICIFTYGNRSSFNFKETLTNVSSVASPPQMPKSDDYKLTFRPYEDYVDEDENIFKKIGNFFVWLGDIFVSLFEYVKLSFNWLLYIVKYLVYIVQFVVLFFGEVFSV